MHGEKFATPNPARIAFISGYVRRRRHMNEPPGKRRFVRSEKTDEFHVRACHPNMKSHPARKQNRVRQLICSTKTQKGSAEIELFSGLTECYPENGRLNRSDEKQKFQL